MRFLIIYTPKANKSFGQAFSKACGCIEGSALKVFLPYKRVFEGNALQVVRGELFPRKKSSPLFLRYFLTLLPKGINLGLQGGFSIALPSRLSFLLLQMAGKLFFRKLIFPARLMHPQMQLCRKASALFFISTIKTVTINLLSHYPHTPIIIYVIKYNIYNDRIATINYVQGGELHEQGKTDRKTKKAKGRGRV